MKSKTESLFLIYLDAVSVSNVSAASRAAAADKAEKDAAAAGAPPTAARNGDNPTQAGAS